MSRAWVLKKKRSQNLRNSYFYVSFFFVQLKDNELFFFPHTRSRSLLQAWFTSLQLLIYLLRALLGTPFTWTLDQLRKTTRHNVRVTRIFFFIYFLLIFRLAYSNSVHASDDSFTSLTFLFLVPPPNLFCRLNSSTSRTWLNSLLRLDLLK